MTNLVDRAGRPVLPLIGCGPAHALRTIDGPRRITPLRHCPRTLARPDAASQHARSPTAIVRGRTHGAGVRAMPQTLIPDRPTPTGPFPLVDGGAGWAKLTTWWA